MGELYILREIVMLLSSSEHPRSQKKKKGKKREKGIAILWEFTTLQ